MNDKQNNSAGADAGSSSSGLGQLGANPIGGSSINAAGFAGQTLDPNEIFRIINKWRILIISAIIAGPLLALGASLLITPIFEARSQIEVTQEAPNLVPGTEQQQPIMLNNNVFMATQLGLMKSESLAERVVDKLRLAQNPRFAPLEASPEARRKAAVGTVRGQVLVENIRDSRLVNITVSGPDPQAASNIANAYAEEFIASGLQREFDASSYARTFLERRLVSTKQRLEETERALVAYAGQQGIIDLGASDKSNGQASLDASSLVELNTALTQAKAERVSAEQRYRQSLGKGSNKESVSSTTIQQLSGQRASLQAEYQEKLATFLPGLPAMIALKERIGSLDREIARANSNIRESIRADFDIARAKEDALMRQVEGLRGSVLDLKSRQIQYTILQREVDTNRTLYDALLQSYKQISAADGVGKNKVSIVDRSKVPGSPVTPNVPINVLLGLVVGIVLGFGTAFLLEFIDDTIKLPDDVTQKLGVTLLGVMPQTPPGETIKEEIADPKSDITEAAYSLRTALQFASGQGLPKSLLITSSRPAEGKSSICLSLAVAFARMGKNVLLIDADMRKPTLYADEGSREDSIGLSNVLAGLNTVQDAIKPTSMENMWLIPAGPQVPNPVELISGTNFSDFLAIVEPLYDLVVIDGPPVLGLADAPLLGSVCGGTVLVIDTGGVHRSLVANSIGRLRAANTHIIGAIMNRFNPKRVGYGYGYGYGYNYSYSYSYGKSESSRRAEDKITLTRR